MKILFENVPRYYELGWDSRSGSIKFYIHKGVLGELFSSLNPKIMADVLYWQNTLQLGEFMADPNMCLGFGPHNMVRSGSRGDFAIFTMALPVIEFVTGECQSCVNEPKSVVRECWDCGGSRMVVAYEHNRAASAVINLSTLLARLTWVDVSKVKSEHKQLVMVELIMSADSSVHGYPLWAAFGSDMVQWVGSCIGRTDMPKVRQAMFAAYKRMYPTFRDRQDFTAWRGHEGRFHLQVPGHCACLGPDGEVLDSFHHHRGYRFGTHNVDMAAQQLSLLAGLAVFWQEARKSLY